MNASKPRDTRFEIRQFVQGPNSFGLLCSERDVHGSAIDPIEVHEGAFTDAEMAQVHAVLELLERKYEAAFDAKAAEHTPATVHALINQGEQAKREAAEAERAAKAAEEARLVEERIASEARNAAAAAEEARRKAAAEMAAALAAAEDARAEKAKLDAEIASAKAAAEAPAEEPTKP